MKSIRLFKNLFRDILLGLLVCSGTLYGQTESADSYYNQALIQREKGEFQKAYQIASLADSLFLNTSDAPLLLQARIKCLRGMMLYNLSAFSEAFNMLNTADSLFALVNHFGGRADCHLFMGNSIWYLEGAESALEQFNQSIQWAEQDESGNRQYRGKYYIDKGYALADMSKYEEAFLWADKGLELDRAHFGAASKQYAEGLMVRAVIFNYQGDYYKSTLGLESALEIQQKLHKDGESQHLAPIYGNLSVTYLNMGDLEEAERYNLKALAAYKSVLKSEHTYVTMIYLNLGDICTNRNQPQEALEWYRKAAPLVGPADVNLHIALQYGWALSLHRLHRYTEADSIYRLLEEPSKAFYGAIHTNTATYYENLASNLCALDSLDAGLRALDKAAEVNRRLYPAGHATEARIWALKASFYQSAGLYEKAIECSEAGLKFFAGRQDEVLKEHRYTFFTLHHARATSYFHASGRDRLKAVQESLVSYGAYEDLTDRILREERSMDARQRAQSSQGDLNEEMLLAHHELAGLTIPQNEEMWRIAEKSKAMILLDGIRRAQMPVLESVLDSIRKTTAAYSFYQKKIFDALQQPGTVAENEVIKWQSAAFDLEARRRVLWKAFRDENTALGDYFDPNKQILPIRFVQDSLLEANQALLEYFVGDSFLFVFVVRPDTFLVEKIKLDSALEGWIEGLRHGLYGYYAADNTKRSDPTLQKKTRTEYLQNAQILYQKLFAPVAHLLPEKVIIVPDGPLGYIPFDALLDSVPSNEIDFKSYPYLLRKFQFSYSYSATLLREMRDKKHRLEPKTAFLGVAPFFTGATSVFENEYATLRNGFIPLPYTKEEVGLARQKMGGDIFAGKSATLAKFLSTAGQYRILHLATHGVADNRVGDYAYLVFNKHPDSTGYALLYVKDLYNLSLNADLVVLSACETGIGKLQRGEGIISLARAFAYSGAKSIITSLWSVSNKSTSELMALFYEELEAHKDKAAALREARLRYIKNASVKNSHPFFWAAFVPVGDMRPVR